MTKISQSNQDRYNTEMKQAIANKDAVRLDLILRSKELLNNRGTKIDTVKIEYDEVKQLQPNFYQVMRNM